MIAIAWIASDPAWAASPRREYLREHREWTRDLVLYWGFGTALTMSATLLEPEFRGSLSAERRRLMNPSAANHADFVARMERDGTQYHDVVFAADSGYWNALKFGNTDDRWNLRLIVDGTEAQLVSIEKIRVPTPLHDSLYVQNDIWSDLWIARFARVSARPLHVELVVGGGYGHGALEWDDLPSVPAVATGS